MKEIGLFRARTPHVVVGNIRTTSKGTTRLGIHGAGIVISHKNKRTYILTARHVVIDPENNLNLGVWPYKNAFPLKAKVERIPENGTDAAIISTKAINHRVAEISRRNPAEGEKVLVLGAPDRSFRVIYRRRILKFESLRYYSRFRRRYMKFSLNGPIKPGFSGGGVYNSLGELVGICYARREKSNNQGVCIPIRALDDLLEPYK
jgi:S1-C subfamily serine protease